METIIILLIISTIIIASVIYFVSKNYSDKGRIIDLREDIIEKNRKIDQLERELKEKNDIKTNIQAKYTQKLYELANSSHENIKLELKDEVEKSEHINLERLQLKLIENARSNANSKAVQILSLAIQKNSSKVTNEHTASTLEINDEDKGKLIGKGGRNIQWFEKTTGVEIIIDDTPGIITISGYNSIRKYLAELTIKKLLKDGRVNPSLIDEAYQKCQDEFVNEIEGIGQKSVSSLGIYDFEPELIKLIGRLKFRTSYGQSILSHSLEMAKLAGIIAEEINGQYPNKNPIDKMVCIKGALLHDIGKSLDEEMTPKGNHIEIGQEICDMYGLSWKIKKCISSHHTTGGDFSSYYDKENDAFCVEACIVDACDNISGGRVGARKEEDKSYDQRIKGLEDIAKNIDGVKKTWVMKGAKELWVFFDAQEIDSKEVRKKVKEVAVLIDQSVKTPSEIKVVGIREDRVVEYSR